MKGSVSFDKNFELLLRYSVGSLFIPNVLDLKLFYISKLLSISFNSSFPKSEIFKVSDQNKPLPFSNSSFAPFPGLLLLKFSTMKLIKMLKMKRYFHKY